MEGVKNRLDETRDVWRRGCTNEDKDRKTRKIKTLYIRGGQHDDNTT